MMKIKDIWNEYEHYSIIFSTICRQLAFAATGIYWIFKRHETIFLSAPVLFALILILFFFAADLFQYFFGLKIHYKIARDAEIEGRKESKKLGREYSDEMQYFKKDEDLNIIKFFFYSKLILLFFAYIILITYYIRIWFGCIL